jgi:3-hydroxyacyl-CoA dehydrogenase
MSQLVSVTTRDGVAVVTIDNPPVNALSAGVPEGILVAIETADSDPYVNAVVVVGAGRTFIAGADIKDLERAASGEASEGPDLHGLLNRIEDCRKPVVMAMHGTALGGGMEVAMAGHFRVATKDAQFGMPEVNLGIIPGAEGTQRLPRLVGTKAAIEMCVSGKPIKADAALKLGLIDRIIEGDLLSGAIEFAREAAHGSLPIRKTRERDEKLDADTKIFEAGRETARNARRNMQAPLAVVDAIEAAATLPFEEGCRREREIMGQRLVSDECRALIHAFFAERAVAKIADIPKDTPVLAIRKAAIIGAGTMGSGIAMACANAGIAVVLKDVDQIAIDRGMAAIARNYESSVKKGRISAAAAEQMIASIQTRTDYDGFEDADLIIEAAYESMELKKAIFSEIDGVAKDACVLATNTSTLDIDAIASVTKRPEQVIGLHFFSPANIMRLVEIVRAAKTDKTVVATALALSKRLGKVGVVVGNCRGFVGNRMMLPYMREAQFVAEEGSSPAEIDAALYDFGMAMGIFAVDDMGGIDVGWRVRQEYGDVLKPWPATVDKLHHMGRLGQKTGKGWYKYEDGRTPMPDPEVEALIEQTGREAGIVRRRISTDEIVERCMYTLVNEGARILEEGFAQRAADIDVIYMTGYGFPAYRGGPMWWADAVGLKKVCERVSEFHRRFGGRWEPAPLLKRLAEAGETFASLDTSKQP